MNPITLRRIAIGGAILTVLVALDAIFMIVTNYKPDDTANNTLHMSDGVTVLIAAVLLLLVTIVAFVLASRARATVAPTPVAQTAPVGTTETVEPEVKG